MSEQPLFSFRNPWFSASVGVTVVIAVLSALAGLIWLLGAFGQLPRVKASTKGEGHERRYFYGSVWAVCCAQPVLWLMWKVLPRTRESDAVKLAIFLGILAYVGLLASLGRLPRTRPIVPGELAVSD